MSKKVLLFLYVFSAFITGLAFPKYNFWFLGWVGLIPFLFALFNVRTLKDSIFAGVVFGIVYFLFVLNWMLSLWQWVGFISVLAWIGLSIFQTLFILMFSIAVYFITKKFGVNLFSILFLSFVWVLLEILRCRGEFATPIGVLGYTQFQNLLLIQIAYLFRVYGVSFVLIFSNFVFSFVIYTLIRKKEYLNSLIALLLLFVVIFISTLYGYLRLSSSSQNKNYFTPLKIAIVQPSFDQGYKMNPQNSISMIKELIFISEKVINSFSVNLIIWPETAIMDFLPRSNDAMLLLKEFTSANKVHLITGGFYYKNGKYFNSAFLFSSKGEILGRYDKEHLVPFGEYLPFRNIFYPLLKSTGFFDIEQSTNKNPRYLEFEDKRIGCLICFESLLDNLAKKRAKNANFLLTITNDAWFGSSSAPYHHIAVAPFRAIENDKYFIQCANNGISAVVDQNGRFLHITNLWDKTVIVSVIYLPLSNVDQ